MKIIIARTTNAFGHLRKSIFTNHCLPVNVKRAVYKAVVLATLLYGSECWAVKASQIPYIANRSRWKCFAVAGLNFHSLENIHGWTVVLHGQSLLHKLFHWRSFAVPIDLRKLQNFSTSNDLQYTVHCLEIFHHCCVRCTLGVTWHQQWTEHISNDTLLRVWDGC